ncbi:MAG: UDP-N-acetylglucosamine 2-epimerase (non-hydrolyzing) [Burkholderiales bacterium]|nr:UDP-N-acetylglucosamine 2-epimerase (non-hydrolyzing) [Burkholderiales bacterium]
MMKIVTVVGARPQFIKAAPVSRALASGGQVREIMVHTGQHYDDNLSAVFFRELDIPAPARNLGAGSGSHGRQTARALEGVEDVLLEEKPDCVLVYGDTNSTLAGALAAAKLRIPVAHVEAGLRSFNRAMPEEINRVVTDHLSAWLYAPTAQAVTHLAAEGIAEERVKLVGDVMFDAALQSAAAAGTPRLDEIGLTAADYVLATIHRAENVDDPHRLQAIMQGLDAASNDIEIVLPLHPRTRKAIAAYGLRIQSPRLRLIDPVGYLEMVALERDARLVVTDSGGVQKEAFFHRVPCLTLRAETEWTELVDAGWNVLAFPASAGAVETAVRSALARAKPAEWPQLYGNGNAARLIADHLATLAGRC